MKKINLFLLLLSLPLSGQLIAQNSSQFYVEDFNNNNNKWEIENASSQHFSSKIENGKYILSNTSTEKDSYFINEAAYKLKQDFTFETQFRIVSMGGSVLFISNFSDWESPFYGMGIKDGKASPVYFTGRGYANGNVYGESIENSDFNKKGTTINLKIVCKFFDDGMYKKQEMTFFVNGQEIGTDNNAHIHESFSKFYFYLTGKTEIEVDYIKITGTPIVEEPKNLMVVSTSPLGATAPNAPSNEVTIKAGELIYSKIFMTEPFIKTVSSGYSIKFAERILIEGDEVSVYEWTMSSSDVGKQGSVFEVPMAPSLSDLKYAQEAFILTKKLPELKPGIHNITIRVDYQKVGMSMGYTLGEVSFKFDNTNQAGKAKFLKMVQNYRAQALKSVKLPTPLMTNSATEASIKQAIIDAGWVQTPIKVIIMEREWKTVTDKYYGNILSRQIKVAVVTKDENGFCTIFYPSIYQKFLGGGKYSSVSELGGIWKIEQDIDCNNVK